MGIKKKKVKKSAFKANFRDFLYSTPIELLVYTMIILSVGLLGMEIARYDLAVDYQHILYYLEMGFTIFFIIEYVLKLSVSDNRWLYVRTNLVDLLAILPFLRFFRLFRGIRVLRLLRLIRLIRLGNMVARRLSMLEGAKNIREILIIIMVFFAALLGGSIGITIFERAENKNLNHLGDGLWWCIVTLTTVGYGDISPVTASGKILGGVLMLVGLSFYGLVAGLGSTLIINRLKKGGEWMVSTFSDHAVILGVNDKLDKIVDILMAQGKRVVVITDDIDRVKQYPENKASIIEGDFILPAILAKARIEYAATAIILSDTNKRTSQDADARSVMATLAVEKIKPEIRTVVEAGNENTAYHLKNAGVDEIILSGDLTAEMLAYSTNHESYSENLGTLMRFVHANRIARIGVPERFWGKKVAEASTTLALERKVLLAIIIKDKETLDPMLKLSEKHEMLYIEIL